MESIYKAQGTLPFSFHLELKSGEEHLSIKPSNMNTRNQSSNLLVVLLTLLTIVEVCVVSAFPATHPEGKSAAEDDQMWPWFGPRPGRMLKRNSNDILEAYARGQLNELPVEVLQRNPWTLLALLNDGKHHNLVHDSGEFIQPSNELWQQENGGSPQFSNLMSHRSILFTPRLGRR